MAELEEGGRRGEGGAELEEGVRRGRGGGLRRGEGEEL